MLFNSLEFAIFFPLVATLYFALAQRWRTPFLLVASCIFYMAFIPAYILILAVTILIDYTAGLYLLRVTGKWRTLLLWTSIVATCAVLFIFKYYNFFNDNFVGLAGLAGWEFSPSTFHIILPIGLSFHTFQSLSYVVEVYRGRQQPEYNLITYATYVMFFPQLVAGPIERPQNLLHQFYEEHRFDYERVTSGLKRMAWGFFKKLVIADRLALYVNDVYAAPHNFNGLQLTIATVFFAYQIYCDFSAYSDIAIGSARVLGFNLMENFNTPYYSRSISEFWQRWHISLSSWFRDYVYIPLGGSRVPRWHWSFNLLLTFAVSGLWHGANWTYVVWGFLNGFYLIMSGLTNNARNTVMARLGLEQGGLIRSVVQIAATFSLVCIGWVFFRAQNLGDAFYILTHFWTDWNFAALKTPHFQLKYFPVAVVGIFLLETLQIVRHRVALPRILTSIPGPLRWTTYAAFVFLTLFLGVFRETQFIYFQF